MIYLYPVLVSNSISKNIIPGICKMIENYIKGNKLVRYESLDNIADVLYNNILQEQSRVYDTMGGGTKDKSKSKSSISNVDDNDEVRRTTSIEIDPRTGERTRATTTISTTKRPTPPPPKSIRLDKTDLRTLSLEPTWMKVDSFNKDGVETSTLIGVKAVPYIVKSDRSLGQMLAYDKQLGKLGRLVISAGRRTNATLRRLWLGIWKKVTFGFGGHTSSTTGDPRIDILLRGYMASGKEFSDIFVLVNQADLSDDFADRSGGIRNLFKLGWRSLIIADDVNKRAAFCMTELHGLCTMIPYNMLYNSLRQNEVYDNLEDAKRAASSIFKMRKMPITKVVSESRMNYKLDEYKSKNLLPILDENVIHEIELINEDFASFAKKASPEFVKTAFKKVIFGKSNNVPAIQPDTLAKIATKKIDPGFNKAYEFSKKVLSNSLGDSVNKKLISAGSIIISAKAVLSRKDTMSEVKNTLMKVTTSFNNKMEKKEKSKLPNEYRADFVLGSIFITIAITTFLSIGAVIGYFVGPTIWKIWKEASSFKEFAKPIIPLSDTPISTLFIFALIIIIAVKSIIFIVKEVATPFISFFRR